MSKKSHQEALKFLQKSIDAPHHVQPFKESFEMKNPAEISGFQGMFGPSALEESKQTQLQMILFDYYRPGTLPQEQVSRDLKELTTVTAELAAINKQSILLQGERIKKAHTLLRRYKEGAFTAWLRAAYGNRQTPYSILQYYELHQSLPPLVQITMDKIPRKAAYTLASRQGSLERKMQIIQGYNGESQNDLMALIVESFPPCHSNRKRKSINEATLDAIEVLMQRLHKRKSDLTTPEKQRLQEMATFLCSITSETPSPFSSGNKGEKKV